MQIRVAWALAAALGAAAPRLPAQSTRDTLAPRVVPAPHATWARRRPAAPGGQPSAEPPRRVEIHGLILVNGFYDGATFDDPDVPRWLAATQDTSGLPNSRIGGLLRQTLVGITARPGRVLGADLEAQAQLDFFGAAPGTSPSRLLTPRVRTAHVRLAWSHVRLLVGQEKPLVSPQSPVSFAAVGRAEFAGSGNLRAWIPQARLTLEVGSALRMGVQAAALDPLQDSAADLASPAQSGLGEKSGRPSAEGRLYVAWGPGDHASSIGFGAHRGWLATATAATLSSEALTADFHIVLGPVALTGEGFTGQALAGLGDGGIGQDIGPQGQLVRTRGGWAQLDIRPARSWEFGGGYGVDDPDDADLATAAGAFPPGARLRNETWEGHLHLFPGAGLLLGAEVRGLRTTYPAEVMSATQVNGFVGMFF